ncbi:L-ornithine N(5)-monooxygenase, partial [Friedmanniomyces endolithicus]
LHVNDSSAVSADRLKPTTETLTADLVVVASGYRRDAHEDLLKGLRGLMPGGDSKGQTWQVRRDYSVEFSEGSVSEDAGVWLQGCNEQTHGLSDSLLSILPNRGGEMVQSIFGTQMTNGVNGHSVRSSQRS